MTEEVPISDFPLTPEEQAEAEQLTEAEIEAIDRALLLNITYQWRKVAMVVGMTMMNYPNRVPNIPDIFYASRICKLAESGHLESQGDLRYMRFSEVRLPTPRSGQPK